MIDTDKYEGHTEGPWVLGSNTEENSNGHRTSKGTDERPIIYSDVAIRTNYKGQEMSVMIGQVNRESAQLIADAPLLLEEVKRLREVEREYNELRENLVNITREYHENFGLISRLLEDVIAND